LRKGECEKTFKLHILTGNKGKLVEFQTLGLSECVDVVKIDVPKVEIQSDDIRKVVLFSASQALQHVRMPFFVEDAGLFIKALNGFPGPYSSYVFKTLGNEGILKLMKYVEDREALFVSVIALYVPEYGIKLFEGVTEGFIAHEVKGIHGFGFDPIFIPKGLSRTYAELTVEEKNRISHRGKAFKAMITWFKQIT